MERENQTHAATEPTKEDAMTLDEIHEHMRVLYIPPHAEGNRRHPDCQQGIVTGTDATHVFVRYGTDRHSHATLPAWLVPDDLASLLAGRSLPPLCRHDR